MNRRLAVLGSIAALTVSPALARKSDQTVLMQDFIDTVIVQGDTSILDQFVTNDIAMPDLDIEGVEAFRAASDAGYTNRQNRYHDATFAPVSVASSGDWCHALMSFEGITHQKRTEHRHVFYVARFRNSLIAELYLG